MRYLHLIVICLLLFFIISSFKCEESKEEKAAKKYELGYVYVEVPVVLTDHPYSKAVEFRAKRTAEIERSVIQLEYPSLNGHSAYSEVKCNELSIYGISYKIVDKTNSKQIISCQIDQSFADESVDFGKIPFVELPCNVKFQKNVDYQLILNIPAKKEIPAKYKRPVFIIGALLDPTL